jgi:hypothetical protein
MPRLPIDGRLAEARSGLARGEFYRLLSTVLGLDEEDPPPMNLADSLQRAEQARDILYKYRHFSLERLYDYLSVLDEITDLRRFIEEMPRLLPEGAVHAARTEPMAAAFYRLISAVLGEPYRPPATLQEMLARLERAMAVVRPYINESDERFDDWNTILREEFYIRRLFDEL